RRRLVGAVRTPRLLDAGEQETGIALERRRNSIEQRRAQRPVRGGGARLSERHFVGTGKRRRAQGGGVAFGVKQTVGAILVVGLQKHDAELAQDRALRPAVEIAVAPKLANGADRLVHAPLRRLRARLRELAGARLR